MKKFDLLAFFLLFLGCFASVYFLPGQSFTLGRSLNSYFLILGSYSLFLFSIYLSLSKINTEKKAFLLKGILFGTAAGLYLIYGSLDHAPLLKIAGAVGLFFFLIYYGQIVPEALMICVIFFAVKTHYFSAPLIRYMDQVPLHQIDLFYLTIGAIVIFQFFVLSKSLKTQLDFSVLPKDFFWISGSVIMALLVIAPIGMSFKLIYYEARVFGIEQWIPLLFYYFGIVAPLEEIFFRGIILNRLRFIFFGKNPYGIPLLISVFLFGLAHLHPLPYILVAGLTGYLYGTGYLLTNRISTPILIHGTIDVLWVTLFYLPH
ncbi:MAG: CPBP family intramembrane metalloprotease [Nitrospirae bacterium]|nr:CPBP family intramembrane metalloprotease [Nitrospirota bacterium]MBI3351210.1 CPBP family intramembrane metalloprotease [Nitrospirota bacterium]